MNTAAYLIVTVLIASASYFGIKWLVRTYSPIDLDVAPGECLVSGVLMR